MSCLTSRVIADDFIIPYIKFGTGEKTLVILPGISVQSALPMAAAVEKQYEIFCSDYTVYLFERREDMPENYSVYDMASDTAKAICELGLRDICLFGVSQGGMIAIIIAAEHPELVAKLALGSSAAYFSDEFVEGKKEWLNYAEQGDAVKLYLCFGKRLYSPEFFEQYKHALRYLAKTVEEKDLKRFITLVKGTEGFDARDEMKSINCPVLAIGDTSDMVLGGNSTPQIAELQKNNPRFEMFMYSGMGHAVYDTAPDYQQRLFAFFGKE